MPRKRKAAREYRAPRLSVHEEIRQRFAPDSLELVMLMVAEFHHKLPTEAERRAFAEIYPDIFYKLFEFEAGVFDKYPAYVVVAHGCCVFRRENFIDFLKEHPARVPFIAPDLTSVRYRDQQAAMAGARADWWQANGWEMTEAERRWLQYGPLKPAQSDTVSPPPFHPRRTDNPHVIPMPPAKSESVN